MGALRDPTLAHVLQLSFSVALLAGGVLCLLVGLGLVFRPGATMRLSSYLNRWVSTRRMMKALEVPRASDLHAGDARRRWVTGLFFAVGGAYAALRLGLGVEAARVAAALGAKSFMLPVAIGLIDAARWILVVFCAGGAVLGVILIAAPRCWAAIEARANRWYSTRQLVAAGDAMHVGLDRWVQSHPRNAGLCVVAASLIPLAVALILLLGRR